MAGRPLRRLLILILAVWLGVMVAPAGQAAAHWPPVAEAVSVHASGPGHDAVHGSEGTPTPTPTPNPWPSPVTPWPSPAATWPASTGCTDILVNGSFEWDGGWICGGTPLIASYVGAPNPIRDGVRSMALGAYQSNSLNVVSYSSIRQAVTIPWGVQTARLRFAYYPLSTAAPGGVNRQELVLLDHLNGDQTIAVPWRVTQNTAAWAYQEVDLTPYRGRTLTIYFNARNAGDGAHTAMFLDQVQLLVCNGAPPAPSGTPAPLPSPASTPSPGSGAAPVIVIQQPTLVSVYTPPSDANGVFVTPAAGSQLAATSTPTATATSGSDIPRNQQGSLLSRIKLNSPWTILCIVGGIALGFMLLAVWLFGRNRN